MLLKPTWRELFKTSSLAGGVGGQEDKRREAAAVTGRRAGRRAGKRARGRAPFKWGLAQRSFVRPPLLGTSCPVSLLGNALPTIGTWGTSFGLAVGNALPSLAQEGVLPGLEARIARRGPLPRSRHRGHLACSCFQEHLAPVSPRGSPCSGLLARGSACPTLAADSVGAGIGLDRAEGVGPTCGRVHARAEGASGKVLEGKRGGGGAVGVRKHGFRKEEKENREEVEGRGRGG